MVGSDKDIWFLKLSNKEQFLYYLTGFGGRHMVGWLAPIIPIICSLAAYMAFLQKDFKWLKQAAAYAAFTIVAYLSVSITSYMTPFLGAAFFGCLVVVLIASSQYIFLNCNIMLVKGILAFVLLFYLSFTVFSTSRSTTVTHSPLSYHESLDRVAWDLHTLLPGNQTVVITGYERSFAGSTITYQMLKKYRHAVTIIDLHRERLFSNALKEIENATAVVTFNNPQTVHLPNASWQTDIGKYLQTNPDFALIGEYPLEKSTTVLIYVRKTLLEEAQYKQQ